MLKVGIIGYGTIGTDVARAILNGEAGAVELKAVLVRNLEKIKDREASPFIITNNAEEFFSQSLDVVIETAGHEALRQYGVKTLQSGSDIIILSVGAFSDDGLYQNMLHIAKENNRKMIIPSGAIAGLDRIAAGSVGPMDEVTITTRKPPKAWFGTIIEEQIDLHAVTEPYCAFEGVARDSARLFPENVNVSAALSLAGVGLDQTKVKIYVDPTVSNNVHEIEARGKFGKVSLQIENTPSPNPKTGFIVAMSTIKTLRNLSTPLIIGI